MWCGATPISRSASLGRPENLKKEMPMVCACVCVCVLVYSLQSRACLDAHRLHTCPVNLTQKYYWMLFSTESSESRSRSLLLLFIYLYTWGRGGLEYRLTPELVLNWKSAHLGCRIWLEGELSTSGILWLEKIADFSCYSAHHPRGHARTEVGPRLTKQICGPGLCGRCRKAERGGIGSGSSTLSSHGRASSVAGWRDWLIRERENFSRVVGKEEDLQSITGFWAHRPHRFTCRCKFLFYEKKKTLFICGHRSGHFNPRLKEQSCGSWGARAWFHVFHYFIFFFFWFVCYLSS